MKANFECPKCHTKQKVGRLRASWECPKCRAQMVIQRKWKAAGKLVGSYEMAKYSRMF